jgi:tRNA pseudouridine38/39 synthase
VSLRLSYDGESYGGFSENVGAPASSASGNTVEAHLFQALRALKLVEGRDGCGYTRCGRTDRGVSAGGQTVALRLRSAFPLGADAAGLPPDSFGEREVAVERAVRPRKASKAEKRARKAAGAPPPAPGSSGAGATETVTRVVREYDYCRMLNSRLPPAIRAVAWSPVTEDFSARFSCTARMYRYFFIRRGLDLGRMRDALARTVGEHDFRNIAKMDTEHVSNFRRRIYETRVVEGPGDDPETRACYFEIRGQAFLWHMVRNIVALMFFVGKGQEEPDVVDRLLDVVRVPSKPNYKMADDCKTRERSEREDPCVREREDPCVSERQDPCVVRVKRALRRGSLLLESSSCGPPCRASDAVRCCSCHTPSLPPPPLSPPPLPPPLPPHPSQTQTRSCCTGATSTTCP